MGSLLRVSKPPALAAAVALAIALAGCGEKDEPATTGPVVPVDTTASQTTTDQSTTTTTQQDDTDGKAAPGSAAAAAQAFLSSPDAELVCDQVLTPEFLRKAYGDRAGCLAARKPASLASANSKLEVGPPSAAGTRVDATPTGGVYDGEKLQILVVEESGAFLVADVKSNAPVGP